jgi:hypothetical protein
MYGCTPFPPVTTDLWTALTRSPSSLVSRYVRCTQRRSKERNELEIAPAPILHTTRCAIWSPLSILLLGAATAICIAVGLPVVAAAANGLGLKAPRSVCRFCETRPTDRIDPFVLRDPWVR